MNHIPPNNTTTTARPAIGFIRVSSKAQACGSDSLPAQEDIVRGYASARNLNLIAIYDETGSAWNRSLSMRPDLTGALIHARSTNAVLIVPHADRLTRRPQDLARIYGYEVPIHVCDQPNGRVGRRRMETLARKAWSEAEHKSFAQLGRRTGTDRSGKMSPGTPEGRNRGRLVLHARREANVWRVRDYALMTPEFRAASRKQQVLMLNDAGVLHLTSTSGQAGEPWTYYALKHLWRAISEEIALHEDDADRDEGEEWLCLEGSAESEGEAQGDL